MISYTVNIFSIAGEESSEIVRTNADGSMSSIPADPANSDYAEYLRYTAWVEAGNDPDEFWSQDTLGGAI